MEISYKRLWKMLIDKDLKKKDLSTVANISQSSVAKMSRGEPVNMEIILRICAALECDIGDVCEAVPAKTADHIVRQSFKLKQSVWRTKDAWRNYWRRRRFQI